MTASDLGHWTAPGRGRLREVLARAACRHRGHDWKQVAPKPGEAVELLFGVFTMCARCGQVSR